MAEYEEVRVHPFAALVRVEREHRPLALLGAERIQKCDSGLGDRRDAHAGCP
jgi:hypothetical protein